MRLRTETARVALVLALLPGACTAGVEKPAAAGRDGVLFWVHGSAGSGGGEDALVEGVVAVDDAGCLHLDADGGPYPTIWPHGTELVGTQPVQLRLRDGTEISLGDRVQGGGGYHHAVDYPELGIPDDCLNRYGEVARFNQAETVTVLPGP